jgi:hypothetical protein
MRDPEDLRKLEKWFRWLDTCPFGMLCGFVKTPNDEYVNELKLEANGYGHSWVTGRVARPLGISERYQPFARVLTNPNFRR